MRFLLDENLSHRICPYLKAAGHGDPGLSLILTREVCTLSSEQLAALLLAALSPELEELLTAGVIATLTRDRVRVRALPLRKRSWP